MDRPSIPLPGKTQPSNSKSTRKISLVSKTTSREPPISRQKRVFGTATNTNINIPTKNAQNNPPNKPSIGISKKLPKPSKPTPVATRIPTTYETSKRILQEKPKLKTKGVCFQKQENTFQEENVTSVVSPRTPMASPTLNKGSETVVTPYHTAEKCSKCRSDRLKTASYWVGQIKLAESVGKHFVSAAFFGLAFESKAEPIRNLHIELKRYLARHGDLCTEKEWRDVSVIYKLLKEEDNAKEEVSGFEEACDLDGEKRDLQDQSVESQN